MWPTKAKLAYFTHIVLIQCTALLVTKPAFKSADVSLGTLPEE